jgi:hypothetical protein
LRSLLTAILVFFLASCPLWCATFETSLGACHQHGGRHHATGDGDQPAPTPVNNDDCVCNGAVPPLDASSTVASLSPTDGCLPPLHWALTCDLGLAINLGLAPRPVMAGNAPPWGHCAPDRAMLQSLRC